MKKLIKYLITLLIGAGMVLLIAVSKGIFSQTLPVDIYRILIDAFFVPGVVITGFGLLVFASNEGTFDGIVYGVSSFIDIFRKKSKKKYATYFDYKESRVDKRNPFLFMVICGSVFLIVSFVFLYLYNACG